MNGSKIDISISDAVVDAYVSRPEGAGPWPGILFYMDAPGLRPTLFEMADRLAALGYVVLLPNLYHRLGAFEPFQTQLMASGGPELDRLMRMVGRLDDESTMRDSGSYLDVLERDPKTRGRKIGTLGYCMGGGLAVGAAIAFPERVAAAASLHGARFVTDENSPAMIAEQARGSFYIGVAEIDRRHTAETTQRLNAAFEKAGVTHQIELYPGAAHGFAVPDLPAYHQPSAEHHWEQIRDFFAKALA